MGKLKRLFKEPSFHILIAFVYFFLFGWPFLSVPEYASPREAYVGLMAAWISFVFVLFFISRR